MPTGDKPEILQAPGTLQARLSMSVGNPATVYVMGVHAETIMGPTMPTPFRPGAGGPYMPPAPGMPGSPGLYAVPANWCPPGPPMPPAPPCPGPAPELPPCPPPAPSRMMMGTAVVNGVLAYAGADYVDMHVAPPGGCPGYMEVLIPYSSIGIALPGGPPV